MNKEMSEQIKNELAIEQVNDLLISLGGDPALKNNIIISRTICHGGNSHKLYYYDNTKLFKCYTECGDEAFDIYDLIIKERKTEGVELSLPQAVHFVIDYFGLTISVENFKNDEDELEDWKILKKYEEKNNVEDNKKIVDLKYYDEKILKFLPTPRILDWEDEGMTKEVLDHAEVCYDPVNQGIVLPHRDKDNNLIGIRERTLIKENEIYGKYRPALLNGILYNHPLGFNLYNLNNSKDNIKKMKKVFVFEGEKSCLLYASYFGIENDLSVAVCGSSFLNYQFELLKECGAEEIIIAFDKQFKEIGDKEWKNWTEKLKNINKKYSSIIQISFLFDKWNLLDYKDSPIDKGADTFLELFKRRIIL